MQIFIDLSVFAAVLALTLEGYEPAASDSNKKDQEIRVFISYAREDSDAAKRLYEELKNAGLTPWLDKKSLIAGQNWKTAIKKAIKKSRYFIPIFSSRSVEKRDMYRKNSDMH